MAEQNDNATDLQNLKDPWLIGVWPGMGGVAVTAGGYLVNALGADLEATLAERPQDLDFVTVSDGLITPGRTPRNMFFVWKDPAERHDLVVFIGEAQPKAGGYALCHRILDHALRLGVKRVFTFAAMATQIHPTEEPRVFGAATNQELLEQITDRGVELLGEGQIGGLNGALLGAASERGLEGVCLLGELPFYAAGLPNPKSAAAVLRMFSELSGIHIDLVTIENQAEQMEPKLVELLERLSAEGDIEAPEPWAESLEDIPEEIRESAEPRLDLEAREHIEDLFRRAREDRARAVELKRELDKLGVFDRYEDRFLDLFKRAA